jgi:uncharacterized protein
MTNKETTLFIGGHPRLEAVREGHGARCAVIAHPHPLYGGDMNNNVVLAARDAALSCGFSTLRFNFRGVGRSEGVYDNGRGEIMDMECALAAAGEYSCLIAYSFGAWIAAGLITKRSLPCILIAPPTGVLSFPSLKGSDCRAVVGSLDQFCDQNVLQEVMDTEHLVIIEGVDHFWFGHERQLTAYLTDVIQENAVP